MTAASRIRWIGIAGALLLLATESFAQGMGRPMRERDRPHPQRMVPDARPAQFAPAEDVPSRRGMTPEERRQLRRDVHEAGRDLYPERMRERRREMRRGE